MFSEAFLKLRTFCQPYDKLWRENLNFVWMML